MPFVNATGRSLLSALVVGFTPAWAEDQVEGLAYTEVSDPVDSYMQAIERVESVGGAYAIELSDLYLGLG